mmetsp:Transcript_1966/g.2265  ORF Transcript_1966/g.2265 Transcript_1966/m.2265 type:complete len:164 (+) Transcript_1966:34-525(+)
MPRCRVQQQLGKVIFLDVDGVLNCHAGSPEPQNLEQLQRILAATGAKVVLSSDWRRKDHLVRDLLSALGEAGIDTSVVIGRTPALKNAARPAEISSWLEEHEGILPDTWIAIDDLPLERTDGPGGRLQGRCVRTDCRTGLTSSDADLAISMLEQSETQIDTVG